MGHHVSRTDAETRHLASQADQNGKRRRLPRNEIKLGELNLGELREENERLRTLVIELSRIVARNALEHK